MKKQILFLLCLLGGFGATAQDPTGIIGINTENPRGVLHIDGATTPATTNPQAGDVSPAQAVDDVIVNSQGRIGIGHLSPEAQIDIRSATPGALRIQDGTEGDEELLFSDANGVGAWAPTAGVWYAALYDSQTLGYTTSFGTRALTTYAGSLISPGGGAVSAAAGSITLPKAGKYRITLSLYWESNRAAAAPYLTRAVLRVGGSNLKTFSNWGGNKSYGVMPTFVSVLELGAGDVLTLATDETASNSANKAQAVLFMVELLLR
jgi:hypothetical protein